MRRYQVHLASIEASVTMSNTIISALVFFYWRTLRRLDLLEYLERVHEAERLPLVVSLEDVARILDCPPKLRDKAARGVTYGAGLRTWETAHLLWWGPFIR
jgi:integrase/recombinase XerD